MAKRDFIVKGNTTKEDSFILKENKTTIAGIIAIVALVIIVASFMKVQDIGFFSEENVAGFASETFVGTRHIELQEHTVLRSRVQIPHLGERVYYAYPQEGILTIQFPETYREATLTQENGLFVGAYADEQAVRRQEAEVRVSIDPNTRIMTINGLSLSELRLPMTEGSLFDATTTVAGDEYYFKVFGSQLEIEHESDIDVVSLEQTNGLLSGEWNGRPVTLNPENNLLIIQDFY